MEFKFRAVDDRPPATSSSSSSNIANFSQQPLPAGYPIPNMWPRQNLELIMRNEMLLRQLEKERIREEMIVGAITRRRMLEAEVRREVMMDMVMLDQAEMANAMSFPLMNNQFNTPYYYSLQDHLALSGHGLIPLMNQFDPRMASMALEAQPALENYNNHKLIMLDGPDPNLCATKQKVVPPPTASASKLPFSGLKKIPKEEWSCALCHFSATDERGLNGHLQGKKHKNKIAASRAQSKDWNSRFGKKHVTRVQKLAQNCETILTTAAITTIGPQEEGEKPKLSDEFAEVTIRKETEIDVDGSNTAGLRFAPPLKKTSNQATVVANTAGLKLEEKVERQSLQVKDEIISNKNAVDREEVESKSELPAQGTQHAENLNNKNLEAIIDKEVTVEFTKFWCEMCQIGVESEVVMEAHKKGKKHNVRFQELSKNAETTNIIVSQEAGEKVKILDDISKPTIKKETENAAERIVGNLNKKWETTVPKNKLMFWCAMCQTGANSEMVMEAHKKGKKHIAKLQKLGQNGEATLTTSTSTTIVSQKGGEKAKISDELAETEIIVEGENTFCVNFSPTSKKTTYQAKVAANTLGLEENLEVITVQREETTSELGKKFKFWCEMCQVGADYGEVMDAHKKGKKHVARLSRCDENA